MQSFNFWNAQTYHFYQWVAEGGSVNVGDLVRRALDGVEHDDLCDIGMDVSTCTRSVLAGLLQDLLQETLVNDAQGPGLHVALLESIPEIGQVDDSPFALWGPILAYALRDINFETVAQVLLLRDGKWAPDREQPEVK
jgi:hypothetical protein